MTLAQDNLLIKMHSQEKFLLVISLILAFFISSESLAAGYSTNLYSASGLGNSYAGSVNGIHDVSDIFFNPATTAGLENNEFIASTSYIKINIDTDSTSAKLSDGTKVTGSDSHDAGVDSVVPALYFTTPLCDKTNFNLAITSPFGLATKYDDSWIGRYSAIESSISTININPSVSYKITDRLSVGAGFQAQYATMLLTKTARVSGEDYFAKSNGSDWGYGYNFGANFKLNEKWKFGIGYRSKIDYKITGNTRVAGLNMYSNFDAKTSTPESLTVGAAFTPAKKFELAYDLTWTRWSRLQSLTITDQKNSGLDDHANFNWHDSFLHSFGANFIANDKWLIRSGIAYEKDAITNANREPRIPNADKIWLSLGFNYKMSKGLSIDSSYVHQIFRTSQAHLTTSTTSEFSTRFKTRSDVISLAIKKEF